MSMSDEELAELESGYARMLIEHTVLAEQMVGVARKILSERATRSGPRDPEPQPGDFRPRPSGPRPPFSFPPLPADDGFGDPSAPQPPYDPPAVYGNGGDDTEPIST